MQHGVLGQSDSMVSLTSSFRFGDEMPPVVIIHNGVLGGSDSMVSLTSSFRFSFGNEFAKT